MYLGLKTLVSLHQAVNPTDVDALTEDEVTIIGAVLDLRSKPVSQIMTPIADVFTLSTDDILNEELVDKVSLIVIYKQTDLSIYFFFKDSYCWLFPYSRSCSRRQYEFRWYASYETINHL